MTCWPPYSVTKHAQERLFERYGIELSREDMAGFLEAVASGEALRVMIKEDGRCIFRWTHKGIVFVFVTSRSGRTLITFLPPNANPFRTPHRVNKRRLKRGRKPRGGAHNLLKEVSNAPDKF